MLVEGYAEMKEAKSTSPRGGGLRALVLLADLDRAIKKMPPKEWHAVLLHGLLAYAVRDAHVCLGISERTLYRRYEAGIAWLVHHLNGTGDD